MHEIVLQDAPDATGAPVKYTLELPGGWEDVTTREQLIVISRNLCLAASIDAKLQEEDADAEPLGMHAVKLDLFKELLDLPESLASRLPDAAHLVYEVDTTDYHTGYAPVETSEGRLLPQLDWCFSPPTFTKSIMRHIEHAGTTWAGLPDDFTGLELNRWIWCATLLQQFRNADKDGVNEALNNLLAGLYHPADSIEPWSNSTIEERAARLADLPVEVKLAAVLNFEAIHATLPPRYPRVFDPRGEAMNSPAGMFSIAYEVAASGVFGNERLVNATAMHNVLLYMEHNLYAQHIAEKRAEAAKKK